MNDAEMFPSFMTFRGIISRDLRNFAKNFGIQWQENAKNFP